METTKPELKSCPFCGGAAEIIPCKRNGLKIRCTKCLISKTQRVLRYTLEWLESKMVEDWNKRV